MKEEKVIGLTKVSSKYLSAVPKDVRKHLEIKRGDRILWVLNEDGSIRVKKA